MPKPSNCQYIGLILIDTNITGIDSTFYHILALVHFLFSRKLSSTVSSSLSEMSDISGDA